MRCNFVRSSIHRLWCRVTGALEILTAALVAHPVMRGVGLMLGAVIKAAAILTVLRHRLYFKLALLGGFTVLLALAKIAS